MNQEYNNSSNLHSILNTKGEYIYICEGCQIKSDQQCLKPRDVTHPIDKETNMQNGKRN